MSLGFVWLKYDHCIYYKSNGDYMLVVALYVDDILFISKGKGLIVELKYQLLTEFEMKDIGASSYILGMKIIR